MELGSEEESDTTPNEDRGPAGASVIAVEDKETEGSVLQDEDQANEIPVSVVRVEDKVGLCALFGTERMRKYCL